MSELVSVRNERVHAHSHTHSLHAHTGEDSGDGKEDKEASSSSSLQSVSDRERDIPSLTHSLAQPHIPPPTHLTNAHSPYERPLAHPHARTNSNLANSLTSLPPLTLLSFSLSPSHSPSTSFSWTLSWPVGANLPCLLLPEGRGWRVSA